MLCCATSSWWTICAKPSQFLGPDPVKSLEVSNQPNSNGSVLDFEKKYIFHPTAASNVIFLGTDWVLGAVDPFKHHSLDPNERDERAGSNRWCVIVS
jgi:hypothetical protein